MNRPTVEVSGEALVWARDQAGYDIAEAAHRVGVDTSKLINIESGDARIAPSMVRKLAEAYRISPVIFFLDELPDVSFEAPADFRTLNSSGLREFSPALRREIQRVRAQIRFMQEFMEDGIASAKFEPIPISQHESADATGAAIRRWLRLPEEQQVSRSPDPARHLKRWLAAIEERGVMVTQVSRIPVSEMRGFCLPDYNFPSIVINGGDATSAKLFTLVHELVHLLAGDECICNSILSSTKDERFANSVAAAALIPGDQLLDSIRASGYEARSRAWTLEEVESISRSFGTSREATLRRLLSFRLTTEDHYQSIRTQLQVEYQKDKERRKNSGGPSPVILKMRDLGQPYVSAVVRARNLGVITEIESAQRLFSKLPMVDSLAERVDLSRA